MEDNMRGQYDGLDLRRPLPVGTRVVWRTKELGRQAGEAFVGNVLSTCQCGDGILAYYVQSATGGVSKIVANQVILP